MLTTLDAILGRCDTILRSLPGARAEVRVYVFSLARSQLFHVSDECQLVDYVPHVMHSFVSSIDYRMTAFAAAEP